MDWCDVCKYNPPDYSSHEPDKPCGDCWVYGEGNEPSKFIETENRQTNADRIRSMTDEELAELMHDTTWEGRKTVEEPEAFKTVEEWLDWLKEEATQNE